MDYKYEVDEMLINQYLIFIDKQNQSMKSYYFKCGDFYNENMKLTSLLISLICNLDNNFRFFNDKQNIELTKIVNQHRDNKKSECYCVKCMLNNHN